MTTIGTVTSTPYFAETRLGNKVLILAGHRFTKDYEKEYKNIFFVENNSGNKALQLKGYRYNRSYVRKDASGEISWRCNRKDFGCRAAVITQGFEYFMYFKNKHNH
ncbi:hypothetical protein MSG28_008200 [Choristoneura fumiferana]|uniref:Uncharacterized protein n=1 Tax=Choristoneura fumiferana TaxID=7141 RepID=A0ACC0JAI3_CHOFU|nr:hypothetical protein MSG28_008200 [Choristoneura fumiferana]